ncbi:MAG: ArsR family transcriptional regulator [Anaerolineae bacterium]|nr:ArsR family transcriptional regulator [Anaerolineae bacterium]
MQDTRQQILEILKHHGEVTVQELSRELELTSVTVRHHLEILRSEGYITDPEVRRSNRPGRPRYVYRLTSTAADLFPNNYSGLADALLSTLREKLSAGERESLLEETARKLAADAGDLPKDHDARLASTVAYLNQQGFVARTEKNEDGTHSIIISNCPYHYVARHNPESCRIDERMIQMLTGGQLERTQGYASQNGLCVYRVTWPTD